MSKPLTERWMESSAANALKYAKRALGRGRFDPASTPFGERQVPWDWRYARIRNEELVRQEVTRCVIRDVNFEGADFTNCAIERSRFENVHFDKADFSGTVHRGNAYINCSFVGTRFFEAAIGYEGNCYERCRFERAKFTRAGCVRGEFDDCEFISCDLKGMDFNASSFARCRFVGKVQDVWFRGNYRHQGEERQYGKARPNRMDQVSFRDAELTLLTFSDECDLSTVIPPVDERHRYYSRWKHRLQELDRIKESWPAEIREHARIFCSVYMVDAMKQDWYILNINDIINQEGIIAANKIIEALDSAA